MTAVLYIHGKGGSAAEAEYYKPLFPLCDVTGLNYKTFTPWQTGEEIYKAVTELKENYEKIILIANSIGAFFSMCAGIESAIGDIAKIYTDSSGGWHIDCIGFNEQTPVKKLGISWLFGDRI